MLRVASASTYRLGQPPQVLVLRAVSKHRQLQLQVAALGTRQAIARYGVLAGRKRLTDVRAGRTPFTVRVRARKRVRQVRVQALDARGAVLASDSQRVRDVVAGRLTSWAQLPGSPRADAIVPIASAPGTGVRRSFEETLLGESDPVAYRPLTLVAVGQIRSAVLSEPAALGYTDLSGTRGLHAVPLDGVPCTRATVAAGEYPARRVLSLVTRRRPSAETARFVRWARTSPLAHRIVARTFALP